MTVVYVSGSFDNLHSRQVRFLEAAAQLGMVHVLLWSDALVQKFQASGPKFPQAERQYFLESVRYVQQVIPVEDLETEHGLPPALFRPANAWAVMPGDDSPRKAEFCKRNGIDYRVIAEDILTSFPEPIWDVQQPAGDRKKVVVTGCYDWLHTGHVRFFEEASALGDLYVVIGSDANVRLLKGEGHPLFQEAERWYMVQSIRHVTAALVSSGSGWMDAEPEIRQIRPHRYVVNEDGDKPEKRAFCQEQGLEYVVLKRTPKAGLPRRESTQLRGF